MRERERKRERDGERARWRERERERERETAPDAPDAGHPSHRLWAAARGPLRSGSQARREDRADRPPRARAVAPSRRANTQTGPWRPWRPGQCLGLPTALAGACRHSAPRMQTLGARAVPGPPRARPGASSVPPPGGGSAASPGRDSNCLAEKPVRGDGLERSSRLQPCGYKNIYRYRYR